MAERSALSRSSLYAGLFGDDTECQGSGAQSQDNGKSLESDTEPEHTSTSTLLLTKPSMKHASAHKPTAPWSTALRFAPRPKQRSNLPEKGVARRSHALSQASVDQALHRNGGIRTTANDEKPCVDDDVKHIAAPPMDIPQDQIQRDKARARREADMFQYVAEQREDSDSAMHTRKVL
ncbi:hypothetical protein MYAM1_002072 [Malassezia yamatoensis]|uniref:Uncharacterized protein n=1 Tax=Malassezia yamatoensis TaxID=253288 RepID=A0AAJ6CHZ6_9BASI|nr:hypothetical protein MYAM1_002072 [Malassezia yamatoensis]